MPCIPIQIDENTTAIVCSIGGHKPRLCLYCDKEADFACDFPIGRHPSGRKKNCNAGLCAEHTMKGNNPKYDFCRPHHAKAEAAYKKRQARQPSLFEEK